MLESAIESRVKNYCAANKVLCYKFVSPSCRGVPDRILVFPFGHVVFVELKQARGDLSPLQKLEHARLTKQGAEVFTFYSFEEFKKWIDTQL